MPEDMTSKITVRASTNDITADVMGAVVFTGNDILWFNETTKELRFKDNNSKKTVVLNHETLSFYIDGEYLFMAFTYVSVGSDAYDANAQNRLLFYYNSTENKYFLKNDHELTSTSDPNNETTSEWNKFIDQLKQEGRYNN